MSISFKHLNRLGAVLFAAAILAATVPTLASANSAQILQDIERAAQYADQEETIGSLPVVQDSGQILTQTSGGVELAVPAGKVTRTAEGALIEGKGQSNIVFQNIGLGAYRASIHISNPNDPEHYSFEVKGASVLLMQFDGSVHAFDDDGQQVAEIEAPWAKDANGRDVPTHYELLGTRLTQIVEHRDYDFTYGIVADPNVWQITKCAAAIGYLVGSNVVLIGKIKALGGAWNAAKLLLGATTRAEKVRAARNVFGTVLGIDVVINNC